MFDYVLTLVFGHLGFLVLIWSFFRVISSVGWIFWETFARVLSFFVGGKGSTYSRKLDRESMIGSCTSLEGTSSSLDCPTIGLEGDWMVLALVTSFESL